MKTLDKNSIVVVCAADDGYAMPLAVTVRSALENLGENRKMILYVIDGGIKEGNKRKLIKSLSSEKCEVRWIPRPDNLLGKFEVLNYFTIDVPGVGKVTPKPYLMNIACYYRLLIPQILPNEYTKAIYLDCDLLVVGDLGKLWDTDIGENYLLAVQEFLTPYVSSPAGLINYRQLGLSPNTKYFNSGVLVFDLEKCRHHEITAKTIKYLQENGEYVRWADTDVLNAVLTFNWGELDPRWNQTPGIYNFPSWQDWKDSPLSEEVFHKVYNDPYIIHFSTGIKPWNNKDEQPSKDLWLKYLDMTAWSGWRLNIWRRGWRRLLRETKKFKRSVSPTQVLRSPS